MTEPNNEGTKEQIRRWLERAYNKARQRDPLEVDKLRMQQKRQLKKVLLARRYGL